MRFYFSLFVVMIFNSYTILGSAFTRHTDNLDESPFFNPAFISNYPAVKKTLIEQENFTEVFFPTRAGHVLQGLFRNVPNPDFTIIFCSGFLPGKQEGIATFLTMMPKNCNILFFNGHGKGRSTGRLSLLNLLHYGRYDYIDTIAAIEYAHFINKGPLLIHGICAGGFHAAHALIKLQDKVNDYNIKGFIFDSAWSSVDQITVSLLNDILLNAKSRIKQWGLKIVRLILAYTASPLVRRYSCETNLLHQIDTLKLPVFFIHSYDDTLTPIGPAQALANKVINKQCWWIHEQSKHSCHHLKHKYIYAEKLAHFCKSVLEQ